jgi:two-component system NarL family sensor kinase
MKKLLFLGLFLVNLGRLSSQVNTDSLIRVAENTSTPDTAKIKLYGDISWELILSDIDKSLKYAEKELKLAKQTGREADEAQAESDVGNIYNRKSDFSIALEHYNKSAEIRKRLNLSDKLASVYVNIATVLARQNRNKEALDIYFKSLKIFEANHDTAKMAVVVGNIGHIYYELEQNDMARPFYRRSLELAKKANIPSLIFSSYNLLAGIFYESGQYDSTLYYYRLAEEIGEKGNMKYGLAVIYNNTGTILMRKKNYTESLEYLNKSLLLREEMQDKLGIGTSNLNMGEVYKITGDLVKSKEHIDKALKIFLEINSIINIKQCYGFLSEIYQAKGELKTAIHYFELYSEYKDSVYNQNVAEQMAEMRTRYESEKKDLEIAKHKTEMQAREQQDFIKNIIMASILVLLVMGSLLVFSVVKRRQQKLKADAEAQIANLKVQRSKAVIEAEEKERVRIAQDLHDGVGQLLSAAKLNLSGLESSLKFDQEQDETLFKNAIGLVNDSVKEVRAVSHNMMPNTLIKLGLASAVREFISKMKSLPNLKIDVEIVGLDERIDQQVEAVLYRVIQEVVNNIIKHARATHISMQLIRHEQELTVMVEDNGVGFDVSLLKTSEGLGLKGIISRVELLNGSVDFDSTPGKGTTVTIEVAC